ncbi:uncharacterized protein LOC108089478 [Drosophila ficusphila]|uniref:uncharacterized protein LOC108089478 n=1 Tax=Drosophila ficusphila TaxID=30025 RepID=UPI0007E70F98|nr:uncharacterized protein LOC108089478 [Drosophila ficusphila]
METPKIINKLLKEAPKNTKGCKEIADLRSLIIEMMKPRMDKLYQISKMQMVPSTRDEFYDEEEDWWPDYELFSNSLAITDMNGLLVYTQDALKGMPDDLKAIAEKFDFAYMVSKPTNIQNKTKNYRLAEELIEDIGDFVIHFNRLCIKILDDRRNIYDLAALTKDTGDRIKVKIFDEQAFLKLVSRINNLRSYITDFCALFEAHVETKEEDEANPLDKFAKRRGTLQMATVDKGQT